MLQGQPEVAASTVQLIGAGAFGAVVGWYVYYINRHRKDDVQLSDIVTLIGAIGGAAVLALFPARSDLFGAYGIGLAAGFFLYFFVLVVLVNTAPGFSVAWFIDGRGPAFTKDQITSWGKGMGMARRDEDGDGFEAVDAGLPSKPSPTTQPTTGPDVVNFGFSQKDAADNKLQKTEPLQRRKSYYFWLNIGKEADQAAIGTPHEIDLADLSSVLTVAIFGFKNELEITAGQDIGELKIQADGSVKVQRQPVDKESISLSPEARADFLERHLLFPISVPDMEATYRLRCNIYCEQILVQSYVVSAKVKSTSEPVYPEARAQKLDYVLSKSLNATHLASMAKEPHLLSLMMNDNGDGSSNFRFLASDGKLKLKHDTNIDGPQLSTFLEQARAALRKVSWGDEEEWNEKKKKDSYRYKVDSFDETKLAKDLAYLARPGSRIYTSFQLHVNPDRSELSKILAISGYIQIALKLTPRAVLPAAIIYDYDWNPNQFDFPNTTFELCPSFSKALHEARREGGPPLEDCVCFNGGCELQAMIAELKENKKSLNALDPIICPSGFWGYRHLLGLPLTLDKPKKEEEEKEEEKKDGDNDKDIPTVIKFEGSLQMFACVSTDKEFTKRDPHFTELEAIKGLTVARDEGYDPFFSRLRGDITPHLLYFYCHGGVKAAGNYPFLQVGPNNSQKDEIDPNNWGAEGIKWTGPNPLVFINGCHTTSLNPEVTLDFVSSFVGMSKASGVIGTEITIFEPLAVKFAEECFKRFIGAPPHKEKMPIGKAVRGARLELLRQGNPLGLVYIPYAVASLRLEQKKKN